mmetsp:Transcript_6510/g.12653  ORF Transcript_6510/g.12653 Transcript_6510/m.12653 type:complete len:82 (-) Transcript_6510:7-252(-)
MTEFVGCPTECKIARLWRGRVQCFAMWLQQKLETPRLAMPQHMPRVPRQSRESGSSESGGGSPSPRGCNAIDACSSAPVAA